MAPTRDLVGSYSILYGRPRDPTWHAVRTCRIPWELSCNFIREPSWGAWHLSTASKAYDATSSRNDQGRFLPRELSRSHGGHVPVMGEQSRFRYAKSLMMGAAAPGPFGTT